MSRSKHPRKISKSDYYYDSGWIAESNKIQRSRIKREVDKALKDPEHEVQVTLKGPKGAYDYP